MSQDPHEDEAADRWTQIASYNWLHEAELSRSVLDAAGIPAEIPDEQTLGVQPLPNLLGGARLLVRAGDLERARAVLNSGVTDAAADADAVDGRSR